MQAYYERAAGPEKDFIQDASHRAFEATSREIRLESLERATAEGLVLETATPRQEAERKIEEQVIRRTEAEGRRYEITSD